MNMTGAVMRMAKGEATTVAVVMAMEAMRPTEPSIKEVLRALTERTTTVVPGMVMEVMTPGAAGMKTGGMRAVMKEATLAVMVRATEATRVAEVATVRAISNGFDLVASVTF